MINTLYKNVKFSNIVPTFETYEEKLLSIKNTYTTGYKLAEIYHDGISDAIYSPISNDSSNIPSYNDISTKLCAESSSRISNDDYLCSQISSLSNIQPISDLLNVEYVDRTTYLSNENININTTKKLYILSDMFSNMNNQNIINLGSAISSLDAVPKFQVDNLSDSIIKLSNLYLDFKEKYENILTSIFESNSYFCIEALEDNVNVNLKRAKLATSGTFQIKLNDGDWKDVSWGLEDIDYLSAKYNLVNAASNKISMSKGDKLKFKNINNWSDKTYAVDTDTTFYYNYSQLKITGGKAKIYGKLAKSLTPEFAASTQRCKLEHMFHESTSLVDASGLNLNDINIGVRCFYGLFFKCTALKSSPKLLSATTLTSYCYDSMFEGCSSLTSTPKLPATELADNCYNNMFRECASILSAPELPATTLADNCYDSMFQDCISLKSAPKLPATKLSVGCYQLMFSKCSSLTSVFELPATSFSYNSYINMFEGCTKIAILHYPKTIENNSTFKYILGSPKFGANNATVYYDL